MLNFNSQVLEVSEKVFIFASEKQLKIRVMIGTTTHRHSANTYWNMVKHLSPDAKIDLITMLSQSLKAAKPLHISAKEYYGVWGDDGMTDDEFVGELKSLRNFNRDVIEL